MFIPLSLKFKISTPLLHHHHHHQLSACFTPHLRKMHKCTGPFVILPKCRKFISNTVNFISQTTEVLYIYIFLIPKFSILTQQKFVKRKPPVVTTLLMNRTLAGCFSLCNRFVCLLLFRGDAFLYGCLSRREASSDNVFSHFEYI